MIKKIKITPKNKLVNCTLPVRMDNQTTKIKYFWNVIKASAPV